MEETVVAPELWNERKELVQQGDEAMLVKKMTL